MHWMKKKQKQNKNKNIAMILKEICLQLSLLRPFTYIAVVYKYVGATMILDNAERSEAKNFRAFIDKSLLHMTTFCSFFLKYKENCLSEWFHIPQK